MKSDGAWRLFVAVHPPESTARAMLGLLRERALPDFRPTPAGQVHLTVQFIGTVEAGALEWVRESVRRSCAGIGAFELRAARLRAIPGERRARLLALETDAPAGLLELKRRLAQRLAREVRGDGAEGFLPHLTLCRFGTPRRIEGLAEVRVDSIAPFAVSDVRLMRSVLHREGAEHVEVERIALER